MALAVISVSVVHRFPDDIFKQNLRGSEVVGGSVCMRSSAVPGSLCVRMAVCLSWAVTGSDTTGD